MTKPMMAGLAVYGDGVDARGGTLMRTDSDVVTADVDRSISLQRVDGFGCCEAFQRASIMHGLDGLGLSNQRSVLDLLWSRTVGAGLSILRLCIGSAVEDGRFQPMSIQRADPGGPAAPPRYVWDGDDSGQLWLAKQAYGYGVRRFFAGAWSAPEYMKTNGTDRWGGMLRGLAHDDGQPGDHESVDWRPAYADYLVQYVRFYADSGIPITDLGFTNEPELAKYYASMQFTPAQCVDFVRILGPTVARSGFRVNLTCCDSVGWPQQVEYSKEIEADPAARQAINIHTAHQYGLVGSGTRGRDSGLATFPLPTSCPTWMTEWDPQVEGGPWNESWDDGAASCGMRLAENLHDAFTGANVSAFIYWFGASVGQTQALVKIDGDSYRTSQRLWAMAAFSRFIRPGAVRRPVAVSCRELKMSVYENTDSTLVFEIINTLQTRIRVRITGVAMEPGTRGASFVTDEANSLAPADVVERASDVFVADAGPRSLTTVVLAPSESSAARSSPTGTGLGQNRHGGVEGGHGDEL